MNALVPMTGNSMALVPTNMTEAMKLAELMSKAKLLPQAVQNPADAFLVINQAMRWGMDPFAVAQEVSVIQGKLMHSGKIVAAAIQSCGLLVGRLSYDYSGEGDNRTVVVRGTMRGEAAPREVSVRAGDVKTTNKMWTTQVDQQLAYSGSRIWGRRHAPEVMLGVYTPEEFDAERAPAHSGPTINARPEPVQQVQHQTRPRDAVDNDSIPALDEPPVDKPKIDADRFITKLGEFDTVAALGQFLDGARVQAFLDGLKESRPELALLVQEAEDKRFEELQLAEFGAVDA